MIRAVIFDMDGLLINSEPLWKQVVTDTYSRLGIHLTDADRHEMMGRKTIDNAKLLYDRYHWPGPTPEAVAEMIIKAMVVAVKKDIKLMPGVDQVLELCKQARLPVAIASSSPEELINVVIDKLVIRGHFSYIYSAWHEPYGKPHPGVFLAVADHLGVPPAQCLVFEDAPSGVLAAKAAKMCCIAVPGADTKKHAFIQIADLVLDSLEEFDATMLASL